VWTASIGGIVVRPFVDSPFIVPTDRAYVWVMPAALCAMAAFTEASDPERTVALCRGD
jgi:hypothetical protein